MNRNDAHAATAPNGPAPWQVRAARPEDADACAAIAVAAWQRVHDSYEILLGRELHELLYSDWQQRKAREVTMVVRDHPERALVAALASDVIGFVTFRADTVRLEGEIGNNAVRPDWQGRGIATALYRAVLAHMRASGMRAVRVTTGLDEGHAPARAAYEKVGFHLGVPHITYYQDLRPESAD